MNQQKGYKILSFLGLAIFIHGAILFIISFVINPDISTETDKTLVWISLEFITWGTILLIIYILLEIKKRGTKK